MTAPGLFSLSPGLAQTPRCLSWIAVVATPAHNYSPTEEAADASVCIAPFAQVNTMRGTKNKDNHRRFLTASNCLPFNSRNYPTRIASMYRSPSVHNPSVEIITRQRGKRRLRSSEYIVKKSCESAGIGKHLDADLGGSEPNRNALRQTQTDRRNAPP